MKTCGKCKCTKPLSDFYKKNGGGLGVKSECKLCTSNYEKERWAKNKNNYVYSDERKEYRRINYLNNKEKVLLQSKKWANNNPEKKRFYNANRRCRKNQATPAWANKKEIEIIYKIANILSIASNIKYEVDHIIPLKGKNVCGLHVDTNLQVITMEKNRMKATYFKDNVWL